MQPNYLRSGLKTKLEAIKHIMECLIQNPACAGLDGQLHIMYGGDSFNITPVKKPKNEKKQW